jgi:hypothetical protein
MLVMHMYNPQVHGPKPKPDPTLRITWLSHAVYSSKKSDAQPPLPPLVDVEAHRYHRHNLHVTNA